VVDLVAQWRRRNPGVACTFETEGDLSGLGELLNITVYRLVQECLTNITKHAGATRIRVALGREGDEAVRVLIEDDGRGMDLNAKRMGLGLVGLRERVEALRGRLELVSEAGRGTQVSVQLPVTAAG
jgi:signal transduction histidine kinase